MVVIINQLSYKNRRILNLTHHDTNYKRSIDIHVQLLQFSEGKKTHTLYIFIQVPVKDATS